MCGLIALKTIEKFGFTSKERDEFHMMMHLNALRGKHSTGVAGVDSQDKGEVNIIKAVGNPYQLMGYDKSDVFNNRILADFDTLIGHGRYATRGAIDAPNAHPYEEGHIVLAHNGVINNFYELKNMQKHKHIDVDSHLIAKLFEEEGVVPTLERIDGAYVFMWYNKENQTLNVVRNHARPLHIGLAKSRKTMIMASEVDTIIWNQNRNGNEMEHIFELPPFEIFTYYPDSLMPEVTKYSPYVPKPIPTTPKTTAVSTTRSSIGVSGIDRITKRKIRNKGKLNESDAILSEYLEESQELLVGNIIEFEIDDWKYNGNGYTSFHGYNDLYPTLKFRSTTTEFWGDNEIYASGVLRGKVNGIYPNFAVNTDVEVAFTVFVDDVKLVPMDIVKPEPDGEEIVAIMDVNGVIENISRFRLAELADNTCFWSGCLITNKDLENPKELLYHVDGKNQGIVCPECARTYIASMRNVH